MEETSYTALDSSSRRRQEEASQVDLGDLGAKVRFSPSLPERARESKLFSLGRIYEKNRAMGIDEDSFFKLVGDLDKNGMAAAKDSTVDFYSGRLFEKYHGVATMTGQGILPHQDFIQILKALEFEDIFSAGRIFERFARVNPRIGLAPGEFCALVRETPVGACLSSRVNSGWDLFGENADTKKGPQGNHQRNEDRNDPLMFLVDKLLEREREARAPPQQADTLGQEGVGLEADKDLYYAFRERRGDRLTYETLAEEITSRLKTIKDIESKISVFETELQAETALKYELPESYSYGKEKLIRKELSKLKEKRYVLVRALEKLRKQRESYLAPPPHARTTDFSSFPPPVYGALRRPRMDDWCYYDYPREYPLVASPYAHILPHGFPRQPVDSRSGFPDMWYPYAFYELSYQTK